MPSTTINPTRMELTRLKGRLKTAQRGHKLLKDKRDELMKQFMDVVRENRALRRRVEEGLMRAHGSFTVAAALMGPEVLEEALSCPRRSVSLEVSTRNIMSVNVPVFTFQTDSGDDALLPYGFAQTSGELDAALEKMQAVFADMLELAQVEKTMQLLALCPALDCLDEYRARCFVPGHWVTVCAGGESYAARAVAIDDAGRLIVEREAGRTEALCHGEVSIRPSPLAIR